MKKIWVVNLFLLGSGFLFCFPSSFADKKTQEEKISDRTVSDSIKRVKSVLFFQVEMALAKESGRFQFSFIEKLLKKNISEEEKNLLQEKVMIPFKEQLGKMSLPHSISSLEAQNHFLWFLSLVLAQDGKQQLVEKWSQELESLPLEEKKIKEWKEKKLEREEIQKEFEKQAWDLIKEIRPNRFLMYYQAFLKLEEMTVQEKKKEED